MADAENHGLFPDSISGDRLRELASRLSTTLPDSPSIPTLTFRDGDIDSGGLCDLQLAVIMLINKSTSGLEFVQLLTTSLYLFERCYDSLVESVEEAKVTYEGDDRDVILAELTSYRLAFKSILQQFTELHLGLSTSATLDRIEGLTKKLGNFSTQDTYRSHLLISDGLLESLGLDRSDVDEFIKSST